MEKINEQITKVADIKQVVDNLQGCFDMLTLALNSANTLKVKLTVDFSPDCAECGKYAGFVKDCRDKLLTQAIKDLVAFMACVTRLQHAINPDIQTTNSEYIQQMKDYEAQQQNNASGLNDAGLPNN